MGNVCCHGVLNQMQRYSRFVVNLVYHLALTLHCRRLPPRGQSGASPCCMQTLCPSRGGAQGRRQWYGWCRHPAP